ncbi:hypothetical protein [Micromonospora sp. CV4]|uniref:hypothetical protein n=1 Tax=Micromonospora sp. CV4 TaxID=2478711 RepID=UPI0011C4A836|nr:hypothetical protein [Micromonospora sp. CV4]
MADLVERSGSVVGRWANSGAITPAGAAVGELIGLSIGAPPAAGSIVGASVGSLVGSAAEEMVNLAAPLWRRRIENVSRFVGTVEDEAAIRAEELLREVAEDARLLELLAQTADAAARALDDWKIDTLARVFVRGAWEATDIDSTQVVVDVVRQLERPHLRLMELLARPNPKRSGARTDGVPTPDRWPVKDIYAEDGGLVGALDALVSRLQSLGIAHDVAVGAYVGYETTWALTSFGKQCASYLSRRGNGREQG